MKVVLYGASGNAGSRILRELQSRGHEVIAAVRHPENLPAGTTGVRDDLTSVDQMARTIKGADAVVSAYAPPKDDTDQLVPVTDRQIAAVGQAEVPRLIVVGGAGSLEVAPGVTLLASGHLPQEWVPIATSHAKALARLKASDVNWTYFSPAAYFEAGERTGKYRLGRTELIADKNGNSRISFEDYAIALADELERPAHERAQMSIGY
jgi:putative NADH-flavin reductase